MAAKKRGGKSRKAGYRHPSGQLRKPGPAERERDVLSVGVGARQRRFGLSEDDAKGDKAGTVLGRLYLAKEISIIQYRAGLKYERVIREADKAYLMHPLRSSGDLNWTKGFDSSDGTSQPYVDKCEAAIWMANQCHRSLGRENSGELLARWAVDNVVLEDVELPDAIGELRTGLNRLWLTFGTKMFREAMETLDADEAIAA